MEPDEEKGPIVYMGAEFYPPAEPERPPEEQAEEEEEEKQPIVEGQPSLLEPNPPPVKPKPVRRARKPAAFWQHYRSPRGPWRRWRNAQEAHAGTSRADAIGRCARPESETPDGVSGN